MKDGAGPRDSEPKLALMGYRGPYVPRSPTFVLSEPKHCIHCNVEIPLARHGRVCATCYGNRRREREQLRADIQADTLLVAQANVVLSHEGDE